MTEGGAPPTLENEMTFDSTVFTFSDARINPAIGAGSAADKQLSHEPAGCNVNQCTEAIHIFGNESVGIPDGLLYTVELDIDAGASVGDYPFDGVPNGLVRIITCGGDCDGDGEISIGELQHAINHFLGLALCVDSDPALSCPVADIDGNDSVSLGDLQGVVNNFLTNCNAT